MDKKSPKWRWPIATFLSKSFSSYRSSVGSRTYGDTGSGGGGGGGASVYSPVSPTVRTGILVMSSSERKKTTKFVRFAASVQ